MLPPPMWIGVKAVVLVCLVALLAVAAASAATPAAYRTKVNGICRGYTPTVKKLETAMKQAVAKKDYHAYGVTLGELLVLNLAQDRRIEAVPVPPALKTQMTPILARMKKIDAHVRQALALAQQGDSTGMLTELNTVATLAKPLNAQLDRAGLRDCGSNQT